MIKTKSLLSLLASGSSLKKEVMAVTPSQYAPETEKEENLLVKLLTQERNDSYSSGDGLQTQGQIMSGEKLSCIKKSFFQILY